VFAKVQTERLYSDVYRCEHFISRVSVSVYENTCPIKVKKVKLSLYRPWRPLGLREVEGPKFSDIRLVYGGKIVSLTGRPLFTPRKIPGTHFC
jgi:hypothetical protein